MAARGATAADRTEWGEAEFVLPACGRWLSPTYTKTAGMKAEISETRRALSGRATLHFTN
ncbi:protein of unknown function (plasmid) [Cupriavidus taiwanensis]|uniref:Uncharacterized protein n=1 Tax=Cupriavidus taiwanensis TaxID=164546 RepID=A0A7Z7NRE6_9BURK|nr:hypothetical protein CBM2597_U20022 [Cupriavidus taiwanensis]SOZ96724.1 hypothetical protein CBM2598_U20024 [Cupriavidus taiwanensis]SPC26074.1 hypothetical protein CBM2594_U30096 [Cupriavidus taiwanensis]SPD37891.1 protein of unknown function [Cupriavidus taiwanensis]